MTLPTISGYTAEDLADLSPDELAALEADPGDDDTDLPPQADVSGDKPAAAAQAEPGNAPATEVPAVAAVDTAPAEESAPVDAPVKGKPFVAEVPADADAQLAAAKAAKETAKNEDKKALKDLHDGVIDFDEYQKVKDASDAAIEAANETITTIKTAVNNAKIADSMAAQDIEAAWAVEVNNMFKTGKAEGLDYKGDKALNAEFGRLVKAFGMEATEAGMSDENFAASRWALQEAHKTMKARHAELVKTPATAGAVKEVKDTSTAKPAPNAPRHGLTNLASMPNADRAQGDHSAVAKFADLQGEDLELALASMSTAEVNKLMASL